MATAGIGNGNGGNGGNGGNAVAAGGAEDQPERPAKQQTTAEKYRQLLDADPKLALELALAETERAKLRLAELRDVGMDEKGNFIIRSLTALQTLGRFYANSQLVPERFQSGITPYKADKPNGDKSNDCAIGCNIALRLNVDPLLVIQHMYVVYGRPGFEAKFLIGVMNSSPKIKGRVTFKLGGEGDTRWCEASAVDAETGSVHTQRVDIKMAVAEGWTQDKKGMKSKWVTLPDLMLQYRSAAFLSRIDFPDVIMGLYTVEELEDVNQINLTGQELAGGGVVRSEMADIMTMLGGSHTVGAVPVDVGDGATVNVSKEEFLEWVKTKGQTQGAPQNTTHPLAVEPLVTVVPQNQEKGETPKQDQPVASEQQSVQKATPTEQQPANEFAAFESRLNSATKVAGIQRVMADAMLAEQQGKLTKDQLAALRAKAAAKG